MMHRLLSLGLCALLLGCGPAPEARQESGFTGAVQSEAPLPICNHANCLQALDGRRVRLVGVFGRSLTHRKKRGPGTFEGAMHIRLTEVRGDTRPRDRRNAIIVELGVRPAEERRRLEGQVISVEGILTLDPYARARGAGVEHAAIVQGPPVLRAVRDVRRARGGSGPESEALKRE